MQHDASKSHQYFFKSVYLIFLLQDAMGFQAAWRKAVIHQDRILKDDHYSASAGAFTKIEKIPLPQVSINLVNLRYVLYKTMLIMNVFYVS